jgi:hypothetical protein
MEAGRLTVPVAATTVGPRRLNKSVSQQSLEVEAKAHLTSPADRSSQMATKGLASLIG